jgi:hypothetical protein
MQNTDSTAKTNGARLDAKKYTQANHISRGRKP